MQKAALIGPYGNVDARREEQEAVLAPQRLAVGPREQLPASLCQPLVLVGLRTARIAQAGPPVSQKRPVGQRARQRAIFGKAKRRRQKRRHIRHADRSMKGPVNGIPHLHHLPTRPAAICYRK